MNATDSVPQAGGSTSPASPVNSASSVDSLPLSRPVEDRLVAGVASGIARYLGVDTTLVRIAFAVLALFGGAGLPVYLACWLLIPDEGASQSIASDLAQSLRSRSR